MKLYAISDIHVRHAENRKKLESLRACPDDWLILAGDVGETLDHMRFTFRTLAPKFRQLVWVPGNHELWTIPKDPDQRRGQEKYDALVALCREYGVLSPEDPYPVWPGEGPRLVIAPLFLLYDYSFRPPEVSFEQALPWALEMGVLCTDEAMLHAEPHPSRQAWCHQRLEQTAARLAAVPAEFQTVLINHFPLRQEHVRLWRIPRFSLWCGTKLTEDWHTRFRAHVVVTGHLHVRATDWRDGVRFEEVSLGYPSQYDQTLDAQRYLREILPGPSPAEISR
ncbi:MAG: metallophosphoesterase family protein [Myxococcaceae bacterium]